MQLAISIFTITILVAVVAILFLVDWDCDDDPVALDHHVCSQMRKSGYSEEQIEAFMREHNGHYDGKK